MLLNLFFGEGDSFMLLYTTILGFGADRRDWEAGVCLSIAQTPGANPMPEQSFDTVHRQ
jgi:hypothetical protein